MIGLFDDQGSSVQRSGPAGVDNLGQLASCGTIKIMCGGLKANQQVPLGNNGGCPCAIWGEAG